MLGPLCEVEQITGGIGSCRCRAQNIASAREGTQCSVLDVRLNRSLVGLAAADAVLRTLRQPERAHNARSSMRG